MTDASEQPIDQTSGASQRRLADPAAIYETTRRVVSCWCLTEPSRVQAITSRLEPSPCPPYLPQQARTRTQKMGALCEILIEKYGQHEKALHHPYLTREHIGM